MVKTLEGNLTPTNITTGRGFHFFALLELQLKGESFKTAVEQYFFQMGTKVMVIVIILIKLIS